MPETPVHVQVLIPNTYCYPYSKCTPGSKITPVPLYTPRKSRLLFYTPGGLYTGFYGILRYRPRSLENLLVILVCYTSFSALYRSFCYHTHVGYIVYLQSSMMFFQERPRPRPSERRSWVCNITYSSKS